MISISDSIQKEFYKNYNPDHWLYKISRLKNCHDNYDEIEKILKHDLANVSDEDYKRSLRTEMHFLYFQMVETLFEIIFAVSKHDNRNLWHTLTFSDWRNNYKEISDLSIASNLFTNKIKTIIGDNEVEIPLLRWIFYFIYPSRMTNEDWKNNLDNIQRLLLFFSKDFSDRGEYNAYKHSLRFYNSKFSMSIGITGANSMFNIGTSDDSIVYLEEHKGKPGEPGRVAQTIKPFDFERDCQCCLIIYSMIKNIIETRKYSLLGELQGKEFDFSTFKDINIIEDIIPKTGVTKSSITI
jgi:hypothetical protein